MGGTKQCQRKNCVFQVRDPEANIFICSKVDTIVDKKGYCISFQQAPKSD